MSRFSSRSMNEALASITAMLDFALDCGIVTQRHFQKSSLGFGVRDCLFVFLRASCQYSVLAVCLALLHKLPRRLFVTNLDARVSTWRVVSTPSAVSPPTVVRLPLGSPPLSLIRPFLPRAMRTIRHESNVDFKLKRKVAVGLKKAGPK